MQHRFAGDGALAGHSRRQPADHRAVGGDRRHRRRPRLGGRAARRPRPRAADGHGARCEVVADVRRAAPRRPDDRSSASSARCRSRRRRGEVVRLRVEPGRRRRPARRRSRRSASADAVVLGPGLVVHQRARRTCWCRGIGRGRRATPRVASSSCSTWRRSRGRPPASRPQRHLEVLAAHAPVAAGRHGARRPGARRRRRRPSPRRAPLARRAARPRPGRRRDGSPRHDVDLLALGPRRSPRT